VYTLFAPPSTRYLKQKSFFSKNGGLEHKSVPVWGLVPKGGERIKERVQEGEYGRNYVLMYDFVLMYEFIHFSCRKMRPVETIPGMREKG
jgi:hypothetical protein